MVNVNEEITKEESVYLYIIRKSSENVNFGKVLFNKILYFSDFDFYERYERSITGRKYIKAAHGPINEKFEQTISALKGKGFIKEEHINMKNGHVQMRYLLLKDFADEKLSHEEKQELERNTKRLWGMTASQVSEYSHQDMPYKATKDDEEIDYGLVFYRNPMYSVSEYKN
ncbi:MAG: Panacea domain-containing protein [Cuniculiplasma sp.]